MEQLTQIAVDKIHPSPQNPRKHLGDLSELIASVQQVGIVEPILVRPRPNTKVPGYELVFGHRRHAAALQAGFKTVPAIIRELDDDAALELAITENSMRADVHPLDEADGFEVLVSRGRSTSSIAERIGRTSAYVLSRLQLVRLSPACRKALDEERITLAVALLLARVPDSKLQDEALNDVSDPNGWDPPMKAAEAKEQLEERYLLRLETAPFDLTDAALVAKAGACNQCPKRTGNQRELFPDVKSPDLCTDPVCFRAKLDALWKIRTKEAVKSGVTMLDGKEATAALGYSGGYTRLDADEWIGDKKIALRKLLGSYQEHPPIIMVRDPHTGAHVELVRRADVEKLKRTKDPAASRNPDMDYRAQQKRQQAKDKQRALINGRAIGGAVAAAEKMATDKILRWIVEGYARRAWNETQKAVITRRCLDMVKRKGYGGPQADTEATLLKAVREYGIEGLRGLGLELALLGVAPGGPLRAAAPMWGEAMKALGVDLEKVEQRVKDEVRAKKANAAGKYGRVGKSGGKSSAKTEAKSNGKAKRAASLGTNGKKSKPPQPKAQKRNRSVPKPRAEAANGA